MYCLRCGYKNDDNVTVCKNCNTNIQESQSRYNYNYDRNDHHDQMIYSYKYSNNGQMPERKENDCDDQLDYRYRYSYGTNPPKTNYNTSDNQYSYSENYLYTNTEYDTTSDITTDLIAGDEKYFKAYIGPSYNSIIKQKFSMSTLLLGPLYFLEKKMYAYSLLWLFVLGVIGYYQRNLLEISYILINLFIATKFKKIYISFVDKKIEKIKLQSLDLTTDEIVKKCKQKGRNITESPKDSKTQSKNAIVVIIVIFLIAIIPSVFEVVKTIIEEESYQQYININKDLKYEMPSEFTLVYNTNVEKIYKYQTDTEYCIIKIDKYYGASDYIDDEDFLKYNKSIPSYINTYSKLINDSIWTNINYNGIEYYAILLEEDAYIITIENIQDPNKNCYVLINQFINTLRIA